MCDACVIKSVKNKMMSRRLFLTKGAVAAGTGALASMSAPLPAMASAPERVMDMTHELHPEFPTFGGSQGFAANKAADFAKDGYNLYKLTVNEHTGTHVDAPLHFSENGQSVAEIPVGNLVVPLCVVDIRQKASENPDAQVTPDDLKSWMSANGDIPQGACVAMNSGWDQHVSSPMFRNQDHEMTMHFPGFHLEAAQMLMEEAEVVGLAVDSLSLDYGKSQDFATHYEWLPSGRWGLECIANLSSLPTKGATLIVGAPKHRGGTGGQARVFTMV